MRDFFRRRGAYARYKQWLARENLLEAWYDFEARETETALRAWWAEKTITLRPSTRQRR